MNNIDRKSPSLIVTDRMRSVLSALDNDQPNVYGPFGFLSRNKLSRTGLAFNGQLVELTSGNYHLGHGYRVYNPVIFRFQSPDSLSPFAEGGLNAYAYCNADPVNHTDPSGRGRIPSSSLQISQKATTLLKVPATRDPALSLIKKQRDAAFFQRRSEYLAKLKASAATLNGKPESDWPGHYKFTFGEQSFDDLAEHRRQIKAAFKFHERGSYTPDQSGVAYQVGTDVGLFTGHFDTMSAYHVAGSKRSWIHPQTKKNHLESIEMLKWAKAAYLSKHGKADLKTLPIARYSHATGWKLDTSHIRNS